MNKPPKKEPENNAAFATQVGAKMLLKLKARRNQTPGVWFGLGMMGLIGWSVALPTILGAALGIWLDKNYSNSHSWTLGLLIAGLAVGCFNAWHWVTREDLSMQDENYSKDKTNE